MQIRCAPRSLAKSSAADNNVRPNCLFCRSRLTVSSPRFQTSSLPGSSHTVPRSVPFASSLWISRRTAGFAVKSSLSNASLSLCPSMIPASMFQLAEAPEPRNARLTRSMISAKSASTAAFSNIPESLSHEQKCRDRMQLLVASSRFPATTHTGHRRIPTCCFPKGSVPSSCWFPKWLPL